MPPMPEASQPEASRPEPRPIDPSQPEWPLSVDWQTAGGSPIPPAKTVEQAAPERTQQVPAVPGATPGHGPGYPGVAHQPPGPSWPPPPVRAGPAPWLARRPRSRFTRTLTARAVLSTCLAALISVLVTAAVAFPLALRSANGAVRSGLADKSSLAASLINPPTGTSAGAPIRAAVVVRQLRRQDVNAYLVHNGRSDPAGLPPRSSAR